MGCSIRELLARFDVWELSEWEAFYMLEPFGPGFESLRAGIIASTIANVNRGKETKPFIPSDFVISYKKERENNKKVQTVKEQREAMRSIVAAFGGKRKKRK